MNFIFTKPMATKTLRFPLFFGFEVKNGENHGIRFSKSYCFFEHFFCVEKCWRHFVFSKEKKKHMSKTNERSCRIFGKNMVFTPPPVHQSWKKWSNFFSIGRILPKKILVRKKYSLCLFSKKKIEFVCFPRF